MENLIEIYSQFDLFQKSVFGLIGVFVIFSLIKAVFSDIIKNTLFELIVEIIYTNIPVICFILVFAKMALDSNGNIIAILFCGLGILLEFVLLLILDMQGIRDWIISYKLRKVTRGFEKMVSDKNLYKNYSIILERLDKIVESEDEE